MFAIDDRFIGSYRVGATGCNLCLPRSKEANTTRRLPYCATRQIIHFLYTPCLNRGIQLLKYLQSENQRGRSERQVVVDVEAPAHPLQHRLLQRPPSVHNMLVYVQ